MNVVATTYSYPQLLRPPASLLETWDRRLASLGAIMVLLLTTHAFQFLFADKISDGLVEQETAQNSPAYFAFVAAQCGLFFFLLLWNVLLSGVSKRLALVLLISAFVLLSATWSNDPKTTVLDGILFTYMAVSAFVLSIYFHPKRFLRLYVNFGAAMIVASFVLYAILPESAVEPRTIGDPLSVPLFRGVFVSKNSAGMLFASFFLIALMGRGLGLPSLYRWLVVAASLAGIMLADSMTALAVGLLLATGWWLIGSLSLHRRILYYLAFCLALAFVVAVPFADLGNSDLGLLGRDTTFTGRDEVWRQAISAISERPVLGYGYDAFFSGDPFSPAWKFWENFRYFLTSSFHNSAIDVTVSLGLVGLLILMLVCLIAGSVVFNQTLPPQLPELLLLLLAAFILESSMEFAIFHHNNVATMVLFYTFFCAGHRYRLPLYAPHNHQAIPAAPSPRTFRQLH